MSRILCYLVFALVATAPFLLLSSMHRVDAQAAGLKVSIPDYKMKNGSSLTQNMTISVENAGAQNITISSIDFTYHREWLVIGKELPFDISYDPNLKCVCVSVPVTVTLPQDVEGGRDIPILVKGIAATTQLSSSSSLRIFAEGDSSNQWTVIFVSVVVPIAAAIIGVIFVYKRVINR